MVRYTLNSFIESTKGYNGFEPKNSYYQVQLCYHHHMILRLRWMLLQQKKTYLPFASAKGKMRKPSFLLCFLEVLRTVCKSNDKSSPRVIQYAK